MLLNLQQIDEQPKLWRGLVAALDDARARFMLRSFANVNPIDAMRPDDEPPQAASAASVAAVRGVPPLQVVLEVAAEGGAHYGMIFDAGLPTCMPAH